MSTRGLFLVGTPIGNLEDVTLRALRILREVDELYAEDTRAAQVLLQRHGIGRSVRSCFDGNEAERADEIVALLADGKQVGFISEAGMPGISDPGERLAAAATAAGHPVIVVPGPSAAVTALVGSALPAETFLFVGFLPRETGPRQARLGKLATFDATMIFYEAPHRLVETLADMVATFGGERRACVARELTKVYEELRRAPLASLHAHFTATEPRGEICIVVAGAAPDATALSMDEIESEIEKRLAAGESAKEIAAALALKTGLPRRQLYQLAIAKKRD